MKITRCKVGAICEVIKYVALNLSQKLLGYNTKWFSSLPWIEELVRSPKFPDQWGASKECSNPSHIIGSQIRWWGDWNTHPPIWQMPESSHKLCRKLTMVVNYVLYSCLCFMVYWKLRRKWLSYNQTLTLCQSQLIWEAWQFTRCPATPIQCWISTSLVASQLSLEPSYSVASLPFSLVVAAHVA